MFRVPMANAFVKPYRRDGRKRPKSCAGPNDPVIDLVRDWIAGRDRQDAMVRSWQDSEHRLSIEAKASKITFTQAVDSDLPDAQLMRSLMRHIKPAERQLERSAARIIALRPTSPAGALAKIEMALRLQQHTINEDHAWALVNCATAQLRTLVHKERLGASASRFRNA